ncbi:MAG: hypothetical protein ACRCXC_13450 [Legionella sp.]
MLEDSLTIMQEIAALQEKHNEMGLLLIAFLNRKKVQNLEKGTSSFLLQLKKKKSTQQL